MCLTEMVQTFAILFFLVGTGVTRLAMMKNVQIAIFMVVALSTFPLSIVEFLPKILCIANSKVQMYNQHFQRLSNFLEQN